MIKEIKIFFEYLKRLFKKWYAYLPILPDLLDKIQSHLEYTIPVSSNILNIFALFALLYATYQVWNDMRLEKLELEEKLKNPIDYEVKANIKKVKIDLIYIESLIDKNIEKTQSLIHSAEQELEKLSFKGKELDQKMEIIGGATIINGFENIYKTNLKNYIDELKEYSDKKDNYLLEWKNFNDIELRDIYIVDFYITNIGIQFDEDIDIKIQLNNDNKYIRRFDLLDNFYFRFNLPMKPEKKRINDFYLSQSLNNRELNRLKIDSNPLSYKRYEKIEEKIFSIKLRDLKVSDTVSIFRDNGYFIKIADKNDIDVSIISKNFTTKIHKKLVYQDKKD